MASGSWPLPDWNTSTENILAEHGRQRSEKPAVATAELARPVERSRKFRLFCMAIYFYLNNQ
jgi:hypothetical protein